MKLFIILSVVACSYAAKLDRTYLPPASASSAGGGPGSLIAPGPGLDQSSNGPSPFGQSSGAPATSGFGQSSGAPATSGFGQSSGAPTASGFGHQSAPGAPGSHGSHGAPGAPGFNQPSGSLGSGPAYGQQSGFGPSGQTGPSSGFGPNASPAAPQTYNQGPSQEGQAFGQNQGQSFSGYQPERPRASLDRNAEILRYDNQNDGETFAYSFETSNGISAEESGVATNGVQAQGGFAYTGDDGQEYRVTYTADENGYQPQGDHLPTPHPIPEEILRSIEENARAAAAGNQEGAYNPAENDSGSGPQQYGAAPSYQGQSQGGPAFQPQGSQGLAYQQGPAKKYGTPSGASSGPGLSTPTQYNQQSSGPIGGPQGPAQQYGAPNAPSGPKFPSGQYNQQPFGSPQGQNAPGQFGSSRPQGQNAPGQFGISRPQSQDQGPSGYQYNRPQSPAFARDSTQGRPSQGPAEQFRPQTHAQSSGAGTNGQGPSAGSSGFGPASRPGQGPTNQSYQPFGPSSGPSQQGPFGSAPASNNPGSPRPSSNQGPFGPTSGPRNQGPFGPSNQGSYNQQSGQSGSRTSMPQSAPYQYNRPSSPLQSGSPQGQSSQPSRNQPDQGRPGQSFGGPRQPPSFSPEEGYKY